MASAVDNLFVLINRQIRALELLRTLTPFPDRITISGDRVKCFCPIHKEQVFSNLFVDLRNGTFKCSMKKCVGFHGGNMIEMYALVRGVSEVQAAAEIVEIQQLDIDVSALYEPSIDYYAKALHAFEEGNLDEAATLANEAAKINGKDCAIRWLSLRIALRKNPEKQTIEALVQLAASFLKEKAIDDAKLALQEVLECQPRNLPAAMMLARIQAGQGQQAEAVELLRKTADMLQEAGRADLAIEALSQIQQWTPDDLDLAMYHVRLTEQTGQLERAAEICWDWTEKLEKKQNWADALKFAKTGLDLEPNEPSLWRRYAHLLAMVGQADRALEELQSLYAECRKQNNPEELTQTLEAILELNPGHTEALRDLASVYLSVGKSSASIQALRKLAENARSAGDIDEAIRSLEAILQQDSSSPEIHEQLAELYLLQEKIDDVLTHLRFCASVWSSAGVPSRASDLLERVEALAPDNQDILYLHGQILEKAGLIGPAVERYTQLALLMADTPDHAPEKLIELCETTLRLRPDDENLLRLQLRELDQLNREGDALATLEILWSVLETKSDFPVIQDILADILQRNPDQLHARLRLAEILTEQGRPEEAAIQFQTSLEKLQISGNTEECLRVLGIWQQSDPTNLAPIRLTSQIRLERGERKEALEALQILVARYLDRNEITDAYRVLEQCCEIDPRSINIIRQVVTLTSEYPALFETRPWIIRLLDMAENQCRREEMETEFESALILTHDDEDIRQRYARYLGEHKETRKALTQWRILADQAEHANAEAGKMLEIREAIARLEPESAEAAMRWAGALESSGRLDQAADTYRQASRFYRANDQPDEAREALFALLKMRPEDGMVREELADLLQHAGDLSEASRQFETLARESEEKGDQDRAAANYEKVVALDDSRLDISERLVEIYERTGAPTRALAHLRRLHDAAMSKKKWKQAQTFIDKMDMLAPESVDVLELRAECLLNQTKPSEAVEVLKHLTDLLLTRGEIAEAQVHLGRLRDLAPDDPDILERTARIEEGQGNTQKALDLYASVESLYCSQQRLDDSLNLLRRIRENHPREWRFRMQLVERLPEKESLEEAFILLAEAYDARAMEFAAELSGYLRGRGSETVLFRKLARVAMGSGHAEPAVEDLRHALDIARKGNDPEECLAICAEALSVASGLFEFRQARIDAHEQLGQMADAALLCVQWARELAEAGEWADARALYEQGLRLQPENLEILEGRLECLEAQEENEEARRVLQSLADAHAGQNRSEQSVTILRRLLLVGGDPVVVLPRIAEMELSLGREEDAAGSYVRLTDVLTAQGQDGKTIDVLEQASRALPRHAEIIRRLVWSRIKAKDIEAAQSDFHRLAAILADSSDQESLIADYETFLTKVPDCAAVRKEYALALESSDRKAEARKQWMQLAEAGRSKKDYSGAIEAMEKTAALDPLDCGARMDLADLLQVAGESGRAIREYALLLNDLEEQGDLEKALEVCGTLIRIDAKANPWIEKRVVLLENSGRESEALSQVHRLIAMTDQAGETEESLRLLRQGVQRHPNSMDLRRSLAEKLELRGDTAEAIEQWLQVAQAHQDAGQHKQAILVLEHVRKESPREWQALDALASLLEITGEQDGAVALLLQMAYLAQSEKNTEKAESFLRRILSVQPGHMGALECLAKLCDDRGDKEATADLYLRICNVFEKQNDIQQAIDALERVRQIRSEDVDIRKRLLDLYGSAGRWDEMLREGLTLAYTLLKGERDSESLDVCRRLRQDLPESRELCIRIGEILRDHRGEDPAEQWLAESAEALTDNGKQELAAQLCRDGLELAPSGARLRAILVECLITSGNVAGALQELANLRALYEKRENPQGIQCCLEKALDIDPDNEETLQQLASLTEKDDPENARILWERRANLARSKGDQAMEVDCLERLCALCPKNIAYLDQLIAVCLKMRADDKMLTVLRQKTELCESCGDLAEAASAIERLLDHQPDDVKLIQKRITLAEQMADEQSRNQWNRHYFDLLIQNKNIKQALAVGETICRQQADQLDILEMLVDLYLDKGELNKALAKGEQLAVALADGGAPEKANALLEKMLAAAPRNCDLLVRAADILERMGSRGIALEYLCRAMEIHRQKNERNAALALAARILDREPQNGQILASIADLYESAKQPNRAIEAYRQSIRVAHKEGLDDLILAQAPRLLQLKPELANERLIFAQALEHKGQPEPATEQYLLFADACRRADRLPEAAKACRKALALHPESIDVHNQLAVLYEALGETEPAVRELNWLGRNAFQSEAYEEAEKFISRAFALDPAGNYNLRLLYAQILQVQDKIPESVEQQLIAAQLALLESNQADAVECLEQARSLAPEHIDLRRQLVRLYRLCSRYDEAHDESLCLGALLLEEGLFEDARIVLDAVIDDDPACKQTREAIAGIYRDNGASSHAAREYAALSLLHQADSDFEMARDYAQNALGLESGLLSARETLAHSLLQLQDPSAVIELQRLVAVYVAAGQLEQAEETCKEILALDPDVSKALSDLAFIYRSQGNESAENEILTQLVELHQRLGQVDQAAEACRHLMERHPDDPQIRSRYIELYAQIGPEVDLIDDHLTLAQIYVDRGEILEASRVYEKAIQLAPNRDDAREAFIRFLFEQGQITRAQSEIETIVEIFQTCSEYRSAIRFLALGLKYRPADASALSQLAEFYLLTRMSGTALDLYREVLSLNVNHGDFAAAADVYPKLIAIDTQNTELRAEAVGFLQEHGFETEAMGQVRALIQIYEERDMLDLAEQTLRSLFVYQPRNIGLLRSIIDMHLRYGVDAEIIDDYLTIADLYAEEGSLKEASEALLQAVHLRPDDLDLRRRYIDTTLQFQPEDALMGPFVELAQLYVKNGRMDEATAMYGRIMQMDASSENGQEGREDAALFLRSRKAVAKPEDAIAPRDPAVKKSDINLPVPTNGALEQAIRESKTSLQLQPKNVTAHMRLAELLLHQQNSAEALEHLERASNVLISKGDLNRAIEACRQALTIQPGSQIFQARLDQVQRQHEIFHAIGEAMGQPADQSAEPAETITPDESNGTPANPGSGSNSKSRKSKNKR